MNFEKMIVQQKKITGEFGNLYVWDNVVERLNFSISRFFIIDGVPQTGVRGGHAHKQCIQALLCLSGSLMVKMENSSGSMDIEICKEFGILVVPQMTWLELYNFQSEDTSLLVLASNEFEESDYIRKYSNFKKEMNLS